MRARYEVPLNIEAFNRSGKARIEKEGYAARMRDESRSARPYGEADPLMAQAWNRGWIDADNEICLAATA